ncbi:MAG: hypothetical protein CVU50_05405 [Candidatus Cloacimonetes bacterium HGW-Cloacimonetes-3]|jgi:formylglycine-generating enzyme required for sulfatase activity|nr:MAG: hypothetical protein CVU50_05405 [Candidatus Cloacimonetes bacterium HGW-Cloacimonetes-3]
MKHILVLLLIMFTSIALCAQNAELIPTAPSSCGTLKIMSRFGGDLYLDGVFVQSLFANGTATWGDTPAGMHEVELRNPKGKYKHQLFLNEDEILTLDFDALPPPYTSPVKAAEVKSEVKPELTVSSTLPPIINSHTFGFSTLEINSAWDGDLYLGGEYLGSVAAEKSKKFKKIPAGEYSLELFNKYYCIRRDIELSSGSASIITLTRQEAKPYANNMVYIPEGSFFMGSQFIDRSEYEHPRHEVSLYPFLIGSTEVTQALWQEVTGSNPSVRTATNQPVTNVSWYEALEFCNALSLKEGLTPCYKINKSFPDANNISEHDSLRYSVTCNWSASGYRLPSEAEWEYTARCADSANRLQYSGSNKINEVAWYDLNSEKKAHEVGQKKANEFELYDMSGNVYEWCWDWWGVYGNEHEDYPTGAVSGVYRIIRGGSWMSAAELCISTSRGGNSPHASSKDIGFRLVRNARAY